MGFGTIKIYKIAEFSNVGCYKISTNDFESLEFYMIIDKKDHILKLYLTQNFNIEPTRIIDCKISDAPIGEMPGIPMMVFSRAILQALKTFNLERFPDSLSYAA